MGQVASRILFPINASDVDNVANSESFQISEDCVQPCGNITFGNQFLMGGELFFHGEKKKGALDRRTDKADAVKIDSFLFGDGLDLELLGNKSVKFPYQQGKGTSDAVNALYALINIRRDSVKFVKVESTWESSVWDHHRLEFTFDCDVPCYIQIHFYAKEVVDGEFIQIMSKYPTMESSEKFYCDGGTGQLFNKYNFNRHNSSNMRYDGGSYFPVVIEIGTVSRPIQVQTTMCTIERSTDASCALLLKPLKQKLIANGVVYLMQEIFGLENKEIDDSNQQFTIDECTGECIICMGNPRDTVILPCKHLCICNGCAETLRYKLNNCPICRSPFKALLKLRTIKGGADARNFSMSGTGRMRLETTTLMEALNGPYQCDNSMSIPKNSTPKAKSKNRKEKECSSEIRAFSERIDVQEAETSDGPAPCQSSPSFSRLILASGDKDQSHKITIKDTTVSLASPHRHATLVRVESRHGPSKSDITNV